MAGCICLTAGGELSLGTELTEAPVRENPAMSLIAGPFAAFTVASLYYCYREYASYVQKKERRLRDRVAYMLWVMAGSVKE